MSFVNSSAPRSPTDKVKKSKVRSGLWWRVQHKITPYVFLSPFLIGFSVFMLYPLVYALNLSLYRKKIVGGVAFVGLDNYLKAFQDANFWSGIQNVLTFGVIQ